MFESTSLNISENENLSFDDENMPLSLIPIDTEDSREAAMLISALLSL